MVVTRAKSCRRERGGLPAPSSPAGVFVSERVWIDAEAAELRTEVRILTELCEH